MTAECPLCRKAAVLKDGGSRYRRGKKTLAVLTRHWECPSGCPDPDGERPFAFMDAALMRANDEAARVAWRAAFGEEMPQGRPRA